MQSLKELMRFNGLREKSNVKVFVTDRQSDVLRPVNQKGSADVLRPVNHKGSVDVLRPVNQRGSVDVLRPVKHKGLHQGRTARE